MADDERTRFYRAQERWGCAGMVKEWPKVFRMPRKLPHGRLVRVSLAEVVKELREIGYVVTEPLTPLRGEDRSP